MGKNRGFVLLLGLQLLFADLAVAARKDFKGLFGSYRREKFTENEARPSDFGVDLLLSSMLPITPVVSSSEGGSNPVGLRAMPESLFFNLEGSAFVTINYNWEIYGSIGYYNYDNRRENQSFTDPLQPVFHLFELEAMPAVLGVRYRFTTDDIVPYVGAGVGYSYFRRKAYYDNSTVLADQEFGTCMVAQIQAGVEFYFAARAGIRLEISAYNLRLASRTYFPGGNFPTFVYDANPWLVRYASGVFFLF